MAFYLLERNDDGSPNGYWQMEFVGELTEGKKVVLYNRFGGKHDHVYHETDEVSEVDSYLDLDWGKALLKPDSPYGFIDPYGKFYGCAYRDHDDLAQLYLKINLPEEFGWVKVYDAYDEIDYYTRRKFLTDAQVKTLMDRGIEVRERDLPDYQRPTKSKQGERDS